MNKKVLLIRYGAYGDHCHVSNAIKAFDEEGYHITFEYNLKGYDLHRYNPRIDEHIMFDPMTEEFRQVLEKNPSALRERWEDNQGYYDDIVIFQDSLENQLIESEDKVEYYWPLYLRRAKNANICYYDQAIKWANLPDKYYGRTGELFFKKQEHENIGISMEKYKDNYVILWALRGTMYQKAIYPLAEPVITEFCKRHPETVVITTGDSWCTNLEWEHPNVVHKSGKINFRTAVLLSKYVDMAITPETGLGICAGAFGTPKIMLMTAASLKNIVGNDKNDYSLQSEAYCSPCTRAIYNTYNCPVLDQYAPDDPATRAYVQNNQRMKLPICVNFDKETILNRMEEVYALHYRRKQYDPSDTRPVYM
jgi:ADP-heptose:LPS heptosyltransferase